MGEPMPGITKSPFRDVRDEVKDYYYNAVLWAYENGITEGTTSTTFSPDATVTRAQFVTFLWRAEGKPASSVPNPFGDLSFGGYYVNAVLWAVSNKITAGTSPITFSPDGPCERGQVVTFLYRDFMGNHAPTTVGRTYRLREDEYFQQFVVEPAGLRIGPGEEYHYIAKVAYNEIVDVMGFSTFDAGDVYHIGSPWSYVCFGGQYGWIESKKLSYEGSMREDTSCREEWNLANDFLPGTKYCAETGCSITFSNPEIVATSHYATFVYVDVTVETPAGDRYFDTCQILEKGDYTGDYWLYMHPQLSCGKISINFSDMQNEIFVAAEGFDLISGLYK